LPCLKFYFGARANSAPAVFALGGANASEDFGKRPLDKFIKVH
jgi:hypothetical protein